MPNSKYNDFPMLKGKKKKYFDILIDARQRLLGQMECHVQDALDSNNNDKKGVTTHMADLGSDSYRHEMELQQLTEEGDILDLIEEAIERLKDDDFGKCVDCGEEIPEQRLLAKPHALFCVKCKNIREKNNNFNPHFD